MSEATPTFTGESYPTDSQMNNNSNDNNNDNNNNIQRFLYLDKFRCNGKNKNRKGAVRFY